MTRPPVRFAFWLALLGVGGMAGCAADEPVAAADVGVDVGPPPAVFAVGGPLPEGAVTGQDPASAPSGGTCGSDVECDDSNPCTLDACDDNTHECVHLVVACEATSTCFLDIDCDDDDPCTEDRCGATLECVHEAVDPCDATPCEKVADCDDDDECTQEGCIDGYCTYSIDSNCAGRCIDADDCDDEEPCTSDTCSEDGVCTNESVPDDTECPANGECTTGRCSAAACEQVAVADGTPCGGEQVCHAGACVECSPASEVRCHEGNLVSFDGCGNPGDVAELCDDGIACTDDDCAEGACTNVPFEDGVACPADDDACTADVCSGGACAHPPRAAESLQLSGALQGVARRSDGGFALVGWTAQIGAGDDDMLVALATATGTVTSRRTVGEAGTDRGGGVAMVSGSAGVYVGATMSSDNSEQLLALGGDGAGGEAWQLEIGGAEEDFGAAAARLPGRGVVVVGGTQSLSTAGGRDLLALAIDADGGELWRVATGTGSRDWGTAGAVSDAGTVFVAGVTLARGSRAADGYVVRLAGDGTILGDHRFQGLGGGAFFGATGAGGGGAVVAGNTASEDGNVHAWMVRMGDDGTTTWERTFGGEGEDRLLGAARASAGGFFAVGSTTSTGAGGRDGTLIRTNADGDVDREHTWGGAGDDELLGVQSIGEGGAVVVGVRDGQAAWSFLDASGVACGER